MERRSRFEYGAQAFETLISVRPWTPIKRTIGGRHISAAGLQASYTVRTDEMLLVTVRFYETQWADVNNLITAGQADQVLTWYPDADDLATSFDVYLDSHEPGVEVEPTREDGFARVFELPLRLRGAGTSAPWTPYFQLA